MILRFLNSSEQEIIQHQTAKDHLTLNFDIDFEDLPSGTGRILHNETEIGTFVKATGSSTTVTLTDGNLTRFVKHGDTFTLITDTPTQVQTVLYVTRTHFNGTPKLSVLIKEVLQYEYEQPLFKYLTQPNQQQLLTLYKRSTTTKHQSLFVREILSALNDVYDLGLSAILVPDGFFCQASVDIIIPAIDLFKNHKVKVEDEFISNKVADAFEFVSIKSITGGTVVPNYTGGQLNNLVFTPTLPAGSVASIVCEIRHKTTNEVFDSTILMYIKSAPAIEAADDLFSVVQWESLNIPIDSLLSNDSSAHPPITFVELVGTPVGGTVTQDNNTLIFTSTGFAGEPASFQYRIKDDINNTAIGNVIFTIQPLPEIDAYVWDTTEALENGTYTPPTFLEIFNTWNRICHTANSWAQPGTPSDISYWIYDAQTDRIIYNLHSPNLNGVISQQSFENYTHQAAVISNDDDSGPWDAEGIILAFAVENSKQYTLTAVRSVGLCFGQVYLTNDCPMLGWALVYNMNRPDEWVITHNNSVVPTPDGSGRGYNDGADWNLRYHPDGVTIRAQRSGDIFRCTSTQLNSKVLVPESELVIDLNSDPRLTKFKGAKPYGYFSWSQPAVTWKDISFTGGLDATKMYNLQTGEVWEYTNNTWSINPNLTIQDVLGYPRIVHNPITGYSYRIEQNQVVKL